MNSKCVLLSLIISLKIIEGSFSPLFSQSNFYAPDTIQSVEITFSQPNWDYMLDTSKYGLDGYIYASARINGTQFDSVGVKYKGYSSYDSSRTKNPLHIKLDYYYNNANFQGFEDVKLSNGFSDPSAVREVLSYEILRNYMDAPQSNFARVYINGIYYGVFSSSESIDKSFLSKKFYSSGNTFFKCNPASVVSGQIPNLLYLGTDSANYYSRYEIKSAIKWKDLIDLCDTLANQTIHVDSILDIDRALWMLAFNNVTVNLDSYTGAFAQNYYLYKDDNERFVPVIWDLNMCFGGFSNTGSGTLNISGMQNMSPLLHASNGARPLIMNLLANSTYNKMYIAHMRTIDNEFFSNGNYLSRAQTLQTLIDTSVQSENFSLYTYSEFQSGLNTNIGNIPGISNLMSVRSTYLNSTIQFQQIQPAITNISSSPAIVYLNDTIWISCKVTNQNSVMLGWRDQTPKRFRRIQMFDDGLHNDGAAGDSIFGAKIIASSALMEYYIYAENANAGIFSPERAEHEFYTVNVVVSIPSAGDVVINEFLADNVNDTTDEAGQKEDWIELYNTTSSPINLYGLYLTDDFSNPKKYSFPNPSFIPANGFLVLWADEDPTTPQYLHTNFNLSAFGEGIMLSNGSTIVLDSISFGIQLVDSSTGRCPDGIGAFSILPATTFNSSNCGNGIEEFSLHYSISVYPNPATDYFIYSSDKKISVKKIEIINPLGQKVKILENPAERHPLSLSGIPDGTYCISFFDENEMRLNRTVTINSF